MLGSYFPEYKGPPDWRRNQYFEIKVTGEIRDLKTKRLYDTAGGLILKGAVIYNTQNLYNAVWPRGTHKYTELPINNK
jgi:hypothetical protein